MKRKIICKVIDVLSLEWKYSLDPRQTAV